MACEDMMSLFWQTLEHWHMGVFIPLYMRCCATAPLIRLLRLPTGSLMLEVGVIAAQSRMRMPST